MAVVPGRSSIMCSTTNCSVGGRRHHGAANRPVVKVVFGDDGVRNRGLLGVAGQRLAQRNFGTKRQLSVGLLAVTGLDPARQRTGANQPCSTHRK